MNQIKIGQYISKIRKEKGLTQEQLADKLLISSKTVSKWERGKGLPELSLMLPLCEMLEISVNELLTGENIAEEIYRKKAEENIIRLIEEQEEWQRSSVLTLLKNCDIYSRIKTKTAAIDSDSIINDICEIAECAVNNGLLALKQFLDKSDTDPFIKEMIRFSIDENKLLSPNELFEVFSVRIILSDTACTDIIRHLIFLQGYMYILHGKTPQKIYDMLLISLGENIP